jgi:hypothetical protein
VNLTWNIVAKDLRRLRWILALWAVIMLAGMGLCAIQERLDPGTYFSFYVGAFVFEWVLLPLFSFGLVMGLILDDPVCEVDAFWITRPISGSRLLAAKAIALVLIWLLPVVLTLPWWLGHGYDIGQVGRAAWQTLGFQVVAGALALPIAVLSPTSGRFVMNVILAAVGYLIVAAIFVVLALLRGEPLPAGLLHTRACLVVWIWIVATGAIAILQFHGRRTRRSIAVVAFAFVAGLAVALWWPWDYVGGPAEGAQSKAITLGFESAAIDANTPDAAPGAEIVGVTLGYGGLAANEAAATTWVRHRLQWPDDRTEVVVNSTGLDQLEKASWSLALGKEFAPVVRSEFPLAIKAQGERLNAEAPAYSASVVGVIRHLEVVARVALKAGMKSEQGGVNVRLNEVFLDVLTGGLAVSLAESAPSLGAGVWSIPVGATAEADPSLFYFLLNPEDGRSLAGRGTPVGEALDVGSVRTFHSVVMFDPSKDWRGGAPGDFREWVRKAILVEVAARDAGSFHRGVEVPQLRLLAPAGQGSRKPTP